MQRHPIYSERQRPAPPIAIMFDNRSGIQSRGFPPIRYSRNRFQTVRINDSYLHRELQNTLLESIPFRLYGCRQSIRSADFSKTSNFAPIAKYTLRYFTVFLFYTLFLNKYQELFVKFFKFSYTQIPLP